jgi:EmrB/QacA subfamily drug resistance transporter
MIGLTRTACDEGVMRAATRGAQSCAERAQRWVLAATILGSSMAFIDGSVVSVALPAIQTDLHTSVRGAQWIVNAYMLTLGALILIGGAAGDRYGRRRVFLLGVIVFTGASVACGLAPNVGMLIAARAVQGVGGALMVPESLAIISAAFPEKERGRAIGTWAGFSALTTALGPVLGGWLVDAASWRAIFFVNVPLGVLTLALALWHVPESRDDSSDAGVDWIGGVLVTLALGAIAYGLTVESDLRWSHPIVLTALLGGTLFLAVFLWWEARARAPMMPLALFRSPQFSGANALTLLLYFALGGALFFVPFDLIRVHGYSAMQAGAAFLPFTLIMGGLSRWSGALIERYDARIPLTVGPAIVAIGLALCALPGIGQSYWTGFFPAMSVLGLGMAIAVAPLTTVVMRAAGDRHSGVASGVNNATARTAGMLSVALLGALAVGHFRAALDAHASAAHVPAEIQRSLLAEAAKLAEAQAPSQVNDVERERLTRLLHESFHQSFRFVMGVAAVLALLSASFATLTLRSRPDVASSRQLPFRNTH